MLINKLHLNEIRKNLYSWIKNFLRDRTQIIILENGKPDSDFRPLLAAYLKDKPFSLILMKALVISNIICCVSNMLMRYLEKKVLGTEL